MRSRSSNATATLAETVILIETRGHSLLLANRLHCANLWKDFPGADVQSYSAESTRLIVEVFARTSSTYPSPVRPTADHAQSHNTSQETLILVLRDENFCGTPMCSS